MAESESLLTQETPAPEPEGNWRDALPDDLRSAGSLKDIPDVSTLAKAYNDAQSFIGRSVRIPGDDANEEVWSDFKDKLTQVPGIGVIPTKESPRDDWSDFYNSMGRPEKADDYNISRPEGAVANPEAETGLLVKAHEIGLNNDQVSHLVNWMNQGLTDIGAQGQESQEEAVSTLQTDWGQAFESKMNDAKNALTTYGGDSLVDELNATGMGNNVALIRAFAEIGKGLSENPAMNLGDQRNAQTTPAEAREQINEIIGNPAHPYNDDSHPNHGTEVNRVSKLYQTVYGTGDEPDLFERKFAEAAG